MGSGFVETRLDLGSGFGVFVRSFLYTLCGGWKAKLLY